MKIVQKGDAEIAGVTDVSHANMRGNKTRNGIAKTFALDVKKDDVRKYVVRREIKRGEKTFYKSPKIQRLVTETRLRRKRVNKQNRVDRWRISKDATAAYEKLISQHAKEQKAARHAAAAAAAAAKKAE